MSAMRWKKVRDFAYGLPLCDGSCRTKADARSVARWRLELMTRPAGNYCEACKRSMKQAWDSALEPEPVEELAVAA